MLLMALLCTVLLQLAGGVILGVALWLRHEPKTSNLLDLQFEGTQAPSTFYISTYCIYSADLFRWKCFPFFFLNYSHICLLCHTIAYRPNASL